MSDLLFTIFVIPQEIQKLFIEAWLTGGALDKPLAYVISWLPA